jgi:hypothetical protein
MNDRIRQLAKQADDYERKLGKGIGPTRDEKFAELIVGECVGIADEYDGVGSTIVNKIKQHFGVEE